MNRSIWPAFALALAALGPSACNSEPEPVARANPDMPDGLSVTDARLMLPAVSGNPAAIYFDVTNDGPKDLFIRAASVQGAGAAMLHQTATWNRQVDMQEVTQQPVHKGETVKFEPGGLHVMADQLDPTLVAGGKTEVTLTFVGGDKASFPVEIRAAGENR